MRKAALLGLGCLVWIVVVLVLLTSIGLVIGRGPTGRYATQGQVFFVVAIAAYIFYAIRILRA